MLLLACIDMLNFYQLISSYVLQLNHKELA